MELHSIDLVIQGYHLGYFVYQDIWAAPIEAVLCCERERFNPGDPYAARYAVAMLHDGAVVGHMPALFQLFVQHF